MMLPRAEHQIAERIARLEARAPADVMVWNPLHSVSGNWEAAGDGWEIEEADPSRFADLLSARLASPASGRSFTATVVVNAQEGDQHEGRAERADAGKPGQADEQPGHG